MRDNRKHRRVSLALPVRYKRFNPASLEADVADDGLPQVASLQNLSAGGVQLVSSEPLGPGDVLELSFELPEHGATRTVAKIVWAREEAEGGRVEYLSGVRFIPVYPEDLARVREYFGLSGEDE